jgi:acyl-CoA thioester hydrolase
MTDDVAVAATFDSRKKASWNKLIPLTIRFGDQDVQGHVNNNAIGAYFEHARVEITYPVTRNPEFPYMSTVIGRLVIDYHAEIWFPGIVEVGIRVSKVGTKSFTLDAALFSGEKCCATSEAVLVFFDRRTRKAMEPPPSVREGLLRLVG